MHFPVSDIFVNPIVPPLMAFIISFFTSMGGVSGAFLLLPLQMTFLGYTAPSVSATNQFYNIVGIPGGIIKYFKEGRMIWQLAAIVVAGTLPGVFIGAFIRIIYLPDPFSFKLFASAVLLYIGIRLLLTVKKSNKHSSQEPLESAVAKSFTFRDLILIIQGEELIINTLKIILLSFIVGIVGGIYGVGGGAIIAPVFTIFFGIPVYYAAGAALAGTFVTSIFAVIFYQLIAPFFPEVSVAPDWYLGALFGAGGFAGMYLGAKLQKFMPEKAIKLILTFCILFIAVKYIYDFAAHYL